MAEQPAACQRGLTGCSSSPISFHEPYLLYISTPYLEPKKELQAKGKRTPLSFYLMKQALSLRKEGVTLALSCEQHAQTWDSSFEWLSHTVCLFLTLNPSLVCDNTRYVGFKYIW